MPAEFRVPGDKSIAHRALILSALAEGESVIEGVPAGRDVLATQACLRQLGVAIESRDASLLVRGAGLRSLGSPAGPLDCRNSGTTMRLLTGMLAGSEITAVLTGDASLQQRPMARVVEPLRSMGASIQMHDGKAPLLIEGRRLRGKDHCLPIASAQVKSALLLAALSAEGDSTIEEPMSTRDHTERLLAAMGARLRLRGATTSVSPLTRPLRPLRLSIPGDFSSAAFWFAAAAMLPGMSLRIVDVGLNPTRTAFLGLLQAMGAKVTVEGAAQDAAEPRGSVTVSGRRLRALKVGAAEVAAAIDEIPILMVVATQAEGTTVIQGAEELRVKESDRIRSMTEGLRRMGAEIEELADGVRIDGPVRLRPASVDSCGDHRVAMALAIAGLAADEPPQIEGVEIADVSYPGFAAQLELVAGG